MSHFDKLLQWQCYSMFCDVRSKLSHTVMWSIGITTSKNKRHSKLMGLMWWCRPLAFEHLGKIVSGNGYQRQAINWTTVDFLSIWTLKKKTSAAIHRKGWHLWLENKNHKLWNRLSITVVYISYSFQLIKRIFFAFTMVLLIVHWDQIIRDTVDFNYINYINYILCGHICIAFQWAEVIKNGRRYIDYWRQFLVLISH